ncbi:MAG: S9 family peptidase, partial [Myxococcota bacterium]
MKSTHIGLAGLIFCACTTLDPKDSMTPTRHPYPESPRGDVVDTYHGEKVADPYRWLEDLDSPETRKWVEAQNEVTFAHLGTLPTRELLRERIAEHWNYTRYGIPFERNGRYFFSKNDGLQNQSVLYWSESLSGEPRVLLDPNTLSEDGTVALSRYSVSNNGKLLAYGLSASGSDWITWHVRNIDTGEDLPDTLEWSKFSGASWLEDDSGFFYSSYDAPKEGEEYEEANYFQKLYLHRLGTAQSADELVFEDRDHKDWGFGGSVTDDGAYLVISVWRGTEERNLLHVKRLSDGKLFPLVTEWKFDYRFIDNDGETFYLVTDDGAPRRRIVAVDLDTPESLTTVVGEKSEVLQGATLFGDEIYGVYLRDAHTVVERMNLAGETVGTLDFPGLGTAYGFGGERGDTETFFSFESYGQPSTIYRYDIAKKTASVWKQPEV